MTGTDLISRWAVIEEAFEYRVDEIENDYDKGYSAAVHDICKMLKKIPSAQPEQRWTPCSERLPREYGEYYVTWKTSDAPQKRFIGIIECDVTGVYDYERHEFKREWLLEDYMKNYSGVEVLAWQPLPEPYKADMNNL